MQAVGNPSTGSLHALPSKLLGLGGFLLSLVLTFLGLTAITFVIGRVMPADPVLAIVGDRASQEVYDQVFYALGLDQPIYVQYLKYLGQLLQGDLGTSIMTAQPVLSDMRTMGGPRCA